MERGKLREDKMRATGIWRLIKIFVPDGDKKILKYDRIPTTETYLIPLESVENPIIYDPKLHDPEHGKIKRTNSPDPLNDNKFRAGAHFFAEITAEFPNKIKKKNLEAQFESHLAPVGSIQLKNSIETTVNEKIIDKIPSTSARTKESVNDIQKIPSTSTKAMETVNKVNPVTDIIEIEELEEEIFVIESPTRIAEIEILEDESHLPKMTNQDDPRMRKTTPCLNIMDGNSIKLIFDKPEKPKIPEQVKKPKNIELPIQNKKSEKIPIVNTCETGKDNTVAALQEQVALLSSALLEMEKIHTQGSIKESHNEIGNDKLPIESNNIDSTMEVENNLATPVSNNQSHESRKVNEAVLKIGEKNSDSKSKSTESLTQIEQDSIPLKLRQTETEKMSESVDLSIKSPENTEKISDSSTLNVLLNTPIPITYTIVPTPVQPPQPVRTISEESFLSMPSLSLEPEIVTTTAITDPEKLPEKNLAPATLVIEQQTQISASKTQQIENSVTNSKEQTISITYDPMNNSFSNEVMTFHKSTEETNITTEKTVTKRAYTRRAPVKNRRKTVEQTVSTASTDPSFESLRSLVEAEVENLMKSTLMREIQKSIVNQFLLEQESKNTFQKTGRDGNSLIEQQQQLDNSSIITSTTGGLFSPSLFPVDEVASSTDADPRRVRTPVRTPTPITPTPVNGQTDSNVCKENCQNCTTRQSSSFIPLAAFAKPNPIQISTNTNNVSTPTTALPQNRSFSADGLFYSDLQILRPQITLDEVENFAKNLQGDQTKENITTARKRKASGGNSNGQGKARTVQLSNDPENMPRKAKSSKNNFGEQQQSTSVTGHISALQMIGLDDVHVEEISPNGVFENVVNGMLHVSPPNLHQQSSLRLTQISPPPEVLLPQPLRSNSANKIYQPPIVVDPISTVVVHHRPENVPSTVPGTQIQYHQGTPLHPQNNSQRTFPANFNNEGIPNSVPQPPFPGNQRQQQSQIRSTPPPPPQQPQTLFVQPIIVNSMVRQQMQYEQITPPAASYSPNIVNLLQGNNSTDLRNSNAISPPNQNYGSSTRLFLTPNDHQRYLATVQPQHQYRTQVTGDQSLYGTIAGMGHPPSNNIQQQYSHHNYQR